MTRGDVPAALLTLRRAEARLLAARAGPADPAAAVAEALDAACGGPVPAAASAAGAAIAAAVAAHGAGFPPGGEPAYHDRHHQAEATRAAGWLAAGLRARGLIGPDDACCCVLAMAGHDLLHYGVPGARPGALEARSAEATDGLCAGLDAAWRGEIRRLILLTDPTVPAPTELSGCLVREADLFGSLTPDLGWLLSAALMREHEAAGDPGAGRVARFTGRLALLRAPGSFTPAAVALGMAEACRIQVAAMAVAACRSSPEEGAVALDALPRAAAMRDYRATLASLGLPPLPAPPPHAASAPDRPEGPHPQRDAAGENGA